jgi:hypothetical protein
MELPDGSGMLDLRDKSYAQ